MWRSAPLRKDLRRLAVSTIEFPDRGKPFRLEQPKTDLARPLLLRDIQAPAATASGTSRPSADHAISYQPGRHDERVSETKDHRLRHIKPPPPPIAGAQ